MSWRDNLRAATFRGVPFFVDDHDMTGGRRGTLHEYPERDKPFFEDLGRKAREFRIEGYVLGPDYMAARDRLLEALEAGGAGALVHPYYGTVQVAVSDRGFSVKETREQGGQARFSITFVQAGESRYPTSAVDTTLRTGLAADATLAAVATSFEEGFRVDEKPAFIADAAALLSDDWLQLVEDRAAAESGPAVPDVLGEIRVFRGDIDTNVRSATGLIGGLIGFGRDIGTVVTDPRAAFRDLLGLSAWAALLASIDVTTASRARQASNQTAFVAATRRIGLVEAARSTAAIPFASIDEAQATRTEIADALEEEMLVAGDGFEDPVYTAFAELRAASVADITARSTGLGRLVDLTPAATLPDVVLAYRFYGDAARAGEITTRNAVRHPGFVPGGRALRVLADG